MVDEEREWLNLKTQSPDHSTDDDVIMDDGYDEDTDADGDDEFKPCFGCLGDLRLHRAEIWPLLRRDETAVVVSC